MTYYSYIFVRQDLTIEQQIIQTGHVTMMTGFLMKGAKDFDRIDHPTGTVPFHRRLPQSTHYVLVGVKNEQALRAVEDVLTKFGFIYNIFNEPDVGYTAICTWPVDENDRGPLLAFNTLRIQQ